MADFSKLTSMVDKVKGGKFDLKGMVSNVKSMINPNAKVPSDVEGDPLLQQAIEIMKCLEALKEHFHHMGEELTKLDQVVGGLTQQLIALKNTPTATAATVNAKLAAPATGETEKK